MEKIITIGGHEVKLSNNVAWTMEYRDQFNKDIVPSIMPLIASGLEAVSSVVADANGDTITTGNIAESISGRAVDILLPMFQVEFVDIIVNVVWAMAKAADASIDPPKKWVRQFDEFPLDEILPTVYDLVISGFVSSKNRARLKAILEGLQPSRLMKSSLPESNED